MTADLESLIAKTADGRSLTETEAAAAFDILMSGGATPVQIAALLIALRVRGETVAEITGAARTMRAKAASITAPDGAVDTCGTGGTGLDTLNVSTTVALVLAGAGVPVAKHGNRAASSKSGSADVLERLGVNLNAPLSAVEGAIAEAKVGFMMAPNHHAAMKHVVPVRKELKVRTIFNILGPLSNPAGAQRQLLGVYDPARVRPLAEVLNHLGAQHAWVVHGADGMDELTTTSESFVAEVKDGAVREFTITPEDAGLPRAKLDDLMGGDPAENASALTALLDGAPGAYRDIVLLNAAAGLIVAGKTSLLTEGVAMAAASVDGGHAKAALTKMIAITNEAPDA